MKLMWFHPDGPTPNRIGRTIFRDKHPLGVGRHPFPRCSTRGPRPITCTTTSWTSLEFRRRMRVRRGPASNEHHSKRLWG